jgi:hypothetical protein
VGQTGNVEVSMRALIIAAVIGLAACAGQPQPAGADGKLTISRAVADGFEDYRASLTGAGSGAYAVTEDGLGGAGAGCDEANCTGPAAVKAVKDCEIANPGRNCVLFARGSEIVVEYEVAQ